MESIRELEKFVRGISSITARSSVKGIGLGVELGVKVAEREAVRVVDGDLVVVTDDVLDSDWLHDADNVFDGLGDVVWLCVFDDDGLADGVRVPDGVGVLDGDTVAEGVREGVAVSEGVIV